MTGDINNDGYMDVYISNDYNLPDELFINTKNKSFINIMNTAIKHTSQFSMGTDIADINNDGWMDIYTADMVSEDHYRNKANMSGMNIPAFWTLISLGFQYQYMFNALQLNREMDCLVKLLNSLEYQKQIGVGPLLLLILTMMV
ncbi:MAG: VCBS repeat-containing protein [Saprospiraceae bacterium]|nr:VCBS repeat-containing protein [Saprospiraceae bacterium]